MLESRIGSRSHQWRYGCDEPQFLGVPMLDLSSSGIALVLSAAAVCTACTRSGITLPLPETAGGTVQGGAGVSGTVQGGAGVSGSSDRSAAGGGARATVGEGGSQNRTTRGGQSGSASGGASSAVAALATFPTTGTGGGTGFYRLNPAHPCFDQRENQACLAGTDDSCKPLLNGKCTVANVCENDSSKLGQPVLFSCPRDMLFSPELQQAAKDDAATYGWSSPSSELPFNYAVVGHDPDVDLDSAADSTCCQCYQLLLGRPLDDAPQPPEIPVPKALVVQVFGTDSGGGKNFDLFMAVGGYGNDNGCFDDPNYPNTRRTYGEFPYTRFPDPAALSTGVSSFYYEGGLKFKSVAECTASGWPLTGDAVRSESCQNRIEQLCNQIESPSSALTATSRSSCIMANAPATLYHQNWQEVRAKRVECPENLTRVTGCRLRDQGLPKPDPNVTTAAQADDSFKSGYTTTTMQDCCAPTCAWKENVKSPVEGGFRSVYSCRANGDPHVIAP